MCRNSFGDDKRSNSYPGMNLTAGLDPNERIRFRNLISELSEERLVLLSLHNVSDIEYIADNVYCKER